MKVPVQPGGQKSSFGIPQEMQEAAAKFKNEKEAKEQEETTRQNAPEMETDNGFDLPNSDTKNELPKILDPMEPLKELGIEINEDDLHQLLFKGALEKTVVLIKSPKKDFTVTIKTLTGEELRIADTLLANEMEEGNMTNDGLVARRTMWTLSFGVIKLTGKDVAPVSLDENKKIDLVKTAQMKSDILHKLSPFILDKIAKAHAVLTLSCNSIVEDPESPLLKRL